MFYAKVNATAIKVRGGTQPLGASKDANGQEDMELALRESEARYQALVEASPTAILAVQKGRCVLCNAASAALLGYASASDVVGANILNHVAPESRGLFECCVPASDRDSGGAAVEIELLRTDHTRVWALVTSVSIQLGGDPALLVISQDITERKRAALEKEALEAELRQSQKMEAIGRLAGGVAHDFNNLLMPIMAYSELAMARLSPESSLYRDIAQVRKAGERAASLTRQLLAFSRRQIMQPQTLELNAIVNDMSRMLQRMIGEDILFQITLEPRLRRIKADRGQMEQVLLNLVVNARDAMPRGGALAIETRNVAPGLAEGGGAVVEHVALTVSDTGCGMDEETMARIFDPFFTTKEKGKGTGLGLATVYGVVEQSGGHIHVASETERGSRFSVFLPALAEEAAMDNVGRVPLESLHGTETILLVEDESLVRKLVEDVLASHGYQVLTARDGGEGVALAAAHSSAIHLVLSDVVLPGMNGCEMAEMLKQRAPDVKILFMSGYTDEDMLRRGVLEAGWPLLQKPFQARELLAKVRETLAGDTLAEARPG